MLITRFFFQRMELEIQSRRAWRGGRSRSALLINGAGQRPEPFPRKLLRRLLLRIVELVEEPLVQLSSPMRTNALQ